MHSFRPQESPGIFLSHSHADNAFAQRVAKDLRQAGVRVWIDEAEIKVGDSLIERIHDGIDKMDFVAALISAKSVKSPWVQKELDVAMNQEIKGRRIKVLPLLLEKCDLPLFLEGKLYADFTAETNYESGLRKILGRLGIVVANEVDKFGTKAVIFKNFRKRVIDYFRPRKTLLEFYNDGSGIDFIRISNADNTFDLYNYNTRPSHYDLINQLFPFPGKRVKGVVLSETAVVTQEQMDRALERIRASCGLSGDCAANWKGPKAQMERAGKAWERWLRNNSIVAFDLE